MLRVPVLCLALLAGASFAVCADEQLKTRLLAGEIQFLGQQQKYFEALQLVDSLELTLQKKLQTQLEQFKRELQQQDDESEDQLLTLADIELGYRMSQRAGRGIRAVLGEDIEQAERNRAAWRLAQIYYSKAQYQNAQFALQLIRGDVFYPFNHDIEYLQARINIHLGEFDDAIAALEKLQYDDRFKGFAAFNLAHVLMAAGRIDEGLEKLAEVGDMDAHDDVLKSLRDKANLVLGYEALKDASLQQARQYLRKVRSNGPFSDKALLGIAWAAMAQQQYRQALAAWNELVQRDHTRAAVQEAMVALPYTWGKLDALATAAQWYQRAITEYEAALTQIAASTNTIQNGQWFAQLRDMALPATDEGISRLRNMPDMTWLSGLLAQPEFRVAVRNVIELDQLSRFLAEARRSTLALQSLVQQREQYAGRIRQDIDTRLQQIDSEFAAMQIRRDSLADMIASITPGSNLQLLADSRQHDLLAALHDISVEAESLPSVQRSVLQQRAGRLRGIIDWQLAQQLDQRLSQLQDELQTLNAAVDDLQQQRDRLAQRRQRINHVSAYIVPLFTLRKDIDSMQNKLQSVREQQQKTLQAMMLGALQQTRQRIERYLVVARYELAKTYDVSASRSKPEAVTDESADVP